MKKIAYIFSIFFIASLFIAGGAMASVTTLSTTQNQIDSQSTSGYPNLDNINVSPNVNLSVFVATTQDSFEIIGFNLKGTIQYGVVSTNAYIYFQAATAITAATGTATSEWATMGGDSGS